MPHKGKTVVLAFLVSCVLSFSGGAAAESGWDAAGIRGGADLTDSHALHAGTFRQYELFVNYLLPWSWRRASGLELRTRVDASAGVLARGGTQGFLATLGPGLALEMFPSTLELDGGGSAALLSRHDFPGRNLGSTFLFNVHGGVSVFLYQVIGVGYHYEHMSNAYLYEHNPGINLHMLEVKYRF